MALRIETGVSSLADVYSAGEEAATRLLERLGGDMPDAVVLFSSIRFADQRLLRGVRGVIGPCPLVGCTDAGGIQTSGAAKRSVTLIGFVGQGVSFEAFAMRDLSNPMQAPEQPEPTISRVLKGERPELVLAFPDGLTTDGSSFASRLDGSFRGAVPIVGCAAADDFFFQRTFQYFNDEVLTDSAPVLCFYGNVRAGVGVRHGWMPLGRPRRVTRVQGRVLYELDGKPAVDLYEDYLGLKREELFDSPFAQLAVTYPLGWKEKAGADYSLRGAVRVGKAGSLICTGGVPEGAEVRLMIGGHEHALEAAQQAAHDALDGLGRSRPSGALVFSSVARQKMLGSEYQGEIDVIRDSLGGKGVQLGGCYGYGEYAPRGGGRGSKKPQNRFHNDSLIVVALA